MTDQVQNNPPSITDDREPVRDLDFDDAGPDSSIWTIPELTVLKSHVEAYRNSLRKHKASYVATVVLQEIKDTWDGRFSKSVIIREADRRREWNIKKAVGYSISVKAFADRLPTIASLHLVQKPCW